MLVPSNMRHREQSNVNASSCLFNESINGAFYKSTLQPTQRWTSYRSIRDRTNPIGKNGRRSPGPCERFRVLYTPMPGVFEAKLWWGFYRQYYSEYWYGGNWPEPSSVLASVPYPPEELILQCGLSAWNSFHQQIPADVSLANFLYELKDFKSTFERLGKAFHFLRDANAMNYTINSFGRARKKKKFLVAGSANSAFLEYNFNWAPFVSDVQKLLGVFDHVDKRLKFLRESRGKPTQIHTKRIDFWDIPNEVYEWNSHVDEWDNRIGFKLKFLRSNFYASATMYQNLVGLDDSTAVFRATLASLGFNNPAKIVWNAIPFSFIADWIAPVNGMLTTLSVQPFVGEFNVYDATHTIQRWAETELYVQGFQSCPDRNNGPQKVGHAVLESYQRKLGLPLTSSDVTFSSLTTQQQRLFTSLLAGNTLFKG